jgi:DNA-binding NarL/FixJ family response regulator
MTRTGDASPLAQDDVQILRLLAEGLTVDSIARRLDRSERTVRRKIRAIGDTLEVGTTVEAIVWAVRAGLI